MFSTTTPEPAPTKPVVYGWMPLAVDADTSPACYKLETFLKMCKVDFDTKYFVDHQMKGSPANKVPWVRWEKLNEGEPTNDSTLIINDLKTMDHAVFDLDADLTTQENAIGTAFKTMLEESTYFTGIIQSRYVDKEQCDKITVPLYFDFVPSFLRGLVAGQVRKKLMRDAQGHGTANLLNDDQVFEKFQMEIQAVSDYLGDKPYFMGTKVTSFDATVFAYMAILAQGEWNHKANQEVRSSKNIMAYIDRLRKEFWPELQEGARESN
eukprot:CAMPEP_0113445334 /NCGR_PEP_ID=MMETSP0014_2-20120614/3133_1 /TAXON_ID=2857 /ORGANISM="Nitzschia sp." /LENGTH=265 /DNA_ID=CAMNT_0000336383 /DNA_START=63 /DNA_END=860 /DNA_ORIENTATION=+ /assembly_acc=CAM_ASM_000159